jgi:Family of unknown function (DUF6526)
MQDYKTHRRFVAPYHFYLSLLILATLIGSVINVFKSADTGEGLYSAALILAICVALVPMYFYLRLFALKAQDRAIRAEENLRFFVRTGNVLDSRLTTRQIIGLRFASDSEYDALSLRAADEGLSEDDIKKSIRDWKEDGYRV